LVKAPMSGKCKTNESRAPGGRVKHNRLSRINIVGGQSPGRNSTEETEEHSDSLTVGLTPRVPYNRKKTSGAAHAFLAGRVETLATWYV
jgi:hypothetical protein